MASLRFEEEGHRYFLDGRELPSNTTMLKAAGLIDDRWYSPESAIRGTEVHNACWFLDEGDLDWATVHPNYQPYVRAFEKFKRETGFKTDINEFLLWSKYGYATRPDLLGVLANTRCLVNLKTGAPDRWVGLQLAGEMIACVERINAQDEEWTRHIPDVNGNPLPQKRFALHLRNDGTYRLKEYADPDDLIVFLGLVRLHHWKNQK